MTDPERILLAHGAGGRLTSELIGSVVVPALGNPILDSLGDSAVLPPLPEGRPAFTTDGFVVDPVEFPGGDVGHLSVCGTVNDLAMVGARPLWLSWALILEEGVERALLERLTASAAAAAADAGVSIVTGDTKVVPRGKGDRCYAVSSGIGVIPPGRTLGDDRIEPGDAILASGPLGDHGATIMACRHDLQSRDLRSCSAPVNHLVETLLAADVAVHALHDPTRGGAVAVCNESAARAGCRFELDEEALPIRPQVRAVCELLGLEPLALASEGRFLAWVAGDDADRAVAALRRHPGGAGAARIGRVVEAAGDRVPVVLRTVVGGTRPLDLLSGHDLPRIC